MILFQYKTKIVYKRNSESNSSFEVLAKMMQAVLLFCIAMLISLDGCVYLFTKRHFPIWRPTIKCLMETPVYHGVVRFIIQF